MHHLVEPPRLAHLAVHPRLDALTRDLELGLDDRSEWAERVEALRPSPLAVLLLQVAGGHVVGDRVAEDDGRGIRLWDIAAGGLIVESAGGVFGRKELGNDGLIALLASNGPAGKALKTYT